MQWYAVLRDTLIAFDLPACTRTVRRKAVETAKFYFFDTGVVRALRRLPRIGETSADFGEFFGGEDAGPRSVSPPSDMKSSAHTCLTAGGFSPRPSARRPGLFHLPALEQDQRGDSQAVPRAPDVGGIVGQSANGRFQE